MHTELRNFGQYVRSVYRHGAAVGGSFALAELLWALDKWNPPWKDHLLLLVGCFIIAQYLAWRDAWLKRAAPQRPILPRGLKLESQAIFHSDDPDHSNAPEITTFMLVAKEDLRGKAIRVLCNGPIYEEEFWTQGTVGTLIYKGDVLAEDTHSMIFDFGGELLATIPSFTAIAGKVASRVPIRVTHVEWVKSRAGLVRHRGR